MVPGCSDMRGSSRRRAASSGLVSRTLQDQFADAGVLPLLCDSVLGRDVKVAQAPLQRRSLVERAASTKRKTRVRYANAGGCNPDCGLCSVNEEAFVLQRSGQCVI